jgi:hypothetical protein
MLYAAASILFIEKTRVLAFYSAVVRDLPQRRQR